jgi:hypothetical protein
MKPRSAVLALRHPHGPQTREQIAQEPVVLLVQDTTEGDMSQQPPTTGLGQVGTERGRGLYQQTVLAILRETRCGAGLCACPSPGCACLLRWERRAAHDGTARNGKRTSGCAW